MRLLSYNIQYGFGSDGRYDLPRVAEVLRHSDLIALQEVDRHWSRTNHDDQPALLVGRGGRGRNAGGGRQAARRRGADR